MLFDELGIYGWDVVEPLVLAAIVADLPVLLIGDIGTNKTEGSKTIAQAVLGAGSAFRHYEVPTLNFDDLVGFLNPKGLAKGTLEFVPTPLPSGRPKPPSSMNSTGPIPSSNRSSMNSSGPGTSWDCRPSSSSSSPPSTPRRLIRPGTWT